MYWIHLSRAQEKGLQFWQTRSHAIIVHDSVPADLDYISSIDISFVATFEELSRYENNLTLGINDGPLPGPKTRRDDFPRAARTFAAIRNEEGRMNPHIPKYLQKRQHNCDQILSGKVGTRKSTGRRHHLHLQQIGDSQENGMNHNEENGKISNGGKRGKCSLSVPSVTLQDSSTFAFFFSKFAY